ADSTACSTVRCSRSKRASSYPTATRTGSRFAASSSTLSSTETTPAPANAFCAVVISRKLNVATVSCAATGAARRETTSTSTATVTASFFMLILLPENKNYLIGGCASLQPYPITPQRTSIYLRFWYEKRGPEAPVFRGLCAPITRESPPSLLRAQCTYPNSR